MGGGSGVAAGSSGTAVVRLDRLGFAALTCGSVDGEVLEVGADVGVDVGADVWSGAAFPGSPSFTVTDAGAWRVMRARLLRSVTGPD